MCTSYYRKAGTLTATILREVLGRYLVARLENGNSIWLEVTYPVDVSPSELVEIEALMPSEVRFWWEMLNKNGTSTVAYR